MICYKDKTFCTFYLKCFHGDFCSCSLTPKVLKEADEWWGKPDAPISTFSTIPNCFHELKDA